MMLTSTSNTSNYSEEEDKRPLTSGLNKKRIGVIMKEEKKCKGIKKCVVKMLTLDDYKKCLDNGNNVYQNQLLFQNKDHEVYTTEVNKIPLNRDNDKQLVAPNQISMLARGHYDAKG